MIPGQLPARNCLLPDLIPCAASGNTPFLHPKEQLSSVLGNLPAAAGGDLDLWGPREGPSCDCPAVGSGLPLPCAPSPSPHSPVSLGSPYFPIPGMRQFGLAGVILSSKARVLRFWGGLGAVQQWQQQLCGCSVCAVPRGAAAVPPARGLGMPAPHPEILLTEHPCLPPAWGCG